MINLELQLFGGRGASAGGSKGGGANASAKTENQRTQEDIQKAIKRLETGPKAFTKETRNQLEILRAQEMEHRVFEAGRQDMYERKRNVDREIRQLEARSDAFSPQVRQRLAVLRARSQRISGILVNSNRE